MGLLHHFAADYHIEALVRGVVILPFANDIHAVARGDVQANIVAV